MKSKKAKKSNKRSSVRNPVSKIKATGFSLSNSVEAVGKKLQKNGYSKLGAKVEEMGDMIESMGKKTTKGRAA